MQSQAEDWKKWKHFLKKWIIDECYITQRTLTKAYCILMGIFALVGSSMVIKYLWVCNMVDGDVNGAGRHGLCISREQWVGGRAQRYLNAVYNEVSSAE